ncbi:translation initiation factor IF-2, partial [Flavobacteriaceae bacterium]|nr:translation initiation factor IF-2 [Flavobacteriaceae bacterium]
MDKNIRLNKVLRELNISIDRAIDFLESKSIEIEKRPTTKISLEIYELLSNEFQTDANKKVASNELSEAKSKEKEALRVKREAEIELLLKKKEEEAKVITAASKIKEIKKVGKIELQPTKVKPKVVITNESTEPTSSKDVKTTAVEKPPLEETKKNEKSVTAATTTVKEDVKVVNEESESESDTVTTQYKKLSGLKSTGETIDLSKFKSEK